MRNGIYSFRLDADGHLSRGSLTLRDGRVSGGDTRVQMVGEFKCTPGTVSAALEVMPVAINVREQRRYGPTEFPLRMNGSGSETQFDLIGVGPRGLIIALAGEWMSPLATALT